MYCFVPLEGLSTLTNITLNLLVPVTVLVLQRGSKILESPFARNDIKDQFVVWRYLWTLIVEICNPLAREITYLAFGLLTNRSGCATNLILANLGILTLPHGQKPIELRMDQEEDWVSRSSKRIVILTSHNEVTRSVHLGLV
jgi:hypothetical protein